MFIHLHALFGHFHAIIAELKSCERDHTACRAENIYSQAFTASVPSPVLCQWFPNSSAHSNHLENVKTLLTASHLYRLRFSYSGCALGFITDAQVILLHSQLRETQFYTMRFARHACSHLVFRIKIASAANE